MLKNKDYFIFSYREIRARVQRNSVFCLVNHVNGTMPILIRLTIHVSNMYHQMNPFSTMFYDQQQEKEEFLCVG